MPGGYFHIRRWEGGPWTWPQVWKQDFGPRSPNKRKNLGSSGTTRGKNWDRIQILGSYLKFKGQNLGYLSPILLEAKIRARTRTSEANFGPSLPPTSLYGSTLLGQDVLNISFQNSLSFPIFAKHSWRFPVQSPSVTFRLKCGHR